MASGVATLALKTNAVVAVLAVLAALVLPSTGRCPSLGPEKPSLPAPAPAPAPPVLCSECPSRCALESCNATVTAKCGSYCRPPPGCDACTSRELDKCRACCGNGTCSCNCDTTAAGKCYRDCDFQFTQCTDCDFQFTQCTDCRRLTGQQCTDTCNSNCAATCVNI